MPFAGIGSNRLSAPVREIIRLMSVTLKDIAQELGLSVGTISKVLREHPDSGAETRERVRKRMQELNYRPHELAVIGCGNVRYAKFLRVPLSTIDQQSQEIGGRAATLALSLIESETPPRSKTILLKPRLVVRESSDRK
jgi:DNA-binding LacI/PurR family transcriptional regulator